MYYLCLSMFLIMEHEVSIRKLVQVLHKVKVNCLSKLILITSIFVTIHLDVVGRLFNSKRAWIIFRSYFMLNYIIVFQLAMVCLIHCRLPNQQCCWNNDIIIALGDVQITPPYDSSCCTGDNKRSVEIIKKYVS